MPLSQEKVLGAALELLDEVGLDELSTRRIATRLDVRVGALYWHFPEKAALLDALAERILGAALDGPLPGGDWEWCVFEWAMRLRRALLAHRDGARVVATFRAPGPSGQRIYDALAQALESAGLPQDAAYTGADTITSYVNGFTVEEQARGAQRPMTAAEQDRQFRTSLEVIIAGLRVTYLPETAGPEPPG